MVLICLSMLQITKGSSSVPMMHGANLELAERRMPLMSRLSHGHGSCYVFLILLSRKMRVYLVKLTSMIN
jgi:hypothetical protein